MAPGLGLSQQPSFPLRCGSVFHFPTRNSPWLLIFTQSKGHGPHCGQKPFKIGPQPPLCLLLESLPPFQPRLLTSHSLTTGSALSPCDLHSCQGVLRPQATKSLSAVSVPISSWGERRAAPGVNPPNSHFVAFLCHRPIYPGGRLLERSQKATGAEGSVEGGDGAGLLIFTKRTLGSG